jgi:molybdopterin-guanine dinucleotide biosynthesis protein A
MGRDKGLLDFGGVPLLVRTARLLEPLVAGVTVVGTPHRYAVLGLHVISDDIQTEDAPVEIRRGPLAGIAAALKATHSPWNLIVACDLPYLSTEWVSWLLLRAQRSRGEALVPRTERGIEPLAAVYRRECVARITAALERGTRKVSDAVEGLRLDLVSPSEWRDIDPSGLILSNMNSPADYSEALKWWSAKVSGASEHVKNPRPVPKPKRRSAPPRRK